MKSTRIKYLIYIIIDVFFISLVLSGKEAVMRIFALFFLIAPFTFILSLAYFQEPGIFMRHWNKWLSPVLKIACLLIALFIFIRTSHFITPNDFFHVKIGSERILLDEIGWALGFAYLMIFAVSVIGAILGVAFNSMAIFSPKRFGENSKEYRMSFSQALASSFIFTFLFSIGALYITSFLV